jgi:hyperosmotically inducible protein
MKTLFTISFFAISTALLPVISQAQDSDADRSHPIHFVKDSVITSKVKAKLAVEHITSVERIKVDTDENGVVYLSGTARSQADANKALTIAQKTEGVVSVKSKIAVAKD